MESTTVTVPEIQTELSLARRRIAELEAQLAAAASADITVASPVPGGGTSGAVPFTVAP